MKTIASRLQKIYGSKVDTKLIERIEKRVRESKLRQKRKRKQGWDEKDVLLITYGDQFHEPRQKTLQTFRQMYREKLSFFELVHFLPFYPYSSDDGFSVIDYKQVDPRLGDWEDIENMEQDARLMFDFVCNHMSAKSDWFKQYLNGSGYSDFFIELDPDTDLSAVTRPRATPLLTPFQTASGETKHIWTTFSADQIDLNFANPEVLYAMLDVLMFYLEHGAAYIRLDAVGFMWKEPGTTCIHLDETHELVKLFRDIMNEVAPGAVMITETNVPHQDNIRYFGDGTDEAQMVYQFPLPPLVLHAIHRNHAGTLREWAKTIGLEKETITYFNFLASHDGIGLNPIRGIVPEAEILQLVEEVKANGGLVSYKKNPDGSESPYEMNVTYMDALSKKDDPDELRLARFLVAHAVLLALPGVPAVYVQSILGSRNDLAGVAQTGQNRSINRQKYDYAEISRALSGGLRKATYEALKQLIEVRKGEPLFHPNVKMEVLEADDRIFAAKRLAGEEELLLLHNLSGEVSSFEWTGSEYQDICRGETLQTGSGFITLSPYEFRWLKLNTGEEQK
ncbi:sugar phosphorylase [Listeria costaricensis]|uniref:sugar phosphorylase n=1 Tax=Listeria costaricensis TaxID=2026604 RepID=UPI000C0797AE|nr:sugar phosphorylase [Listeria costaricensis]